MTVQDMPILNASLNGLAGIFLFLGWRAIKAKNIEQHKRFMIAAFISSTVFLCSYVTYHYLKHGMVTHYQKQGLSKIIYFSILLTHTPLAVLIVPFCIAALWSGLKREDAKHVKITKPLFPTWIYVSVTGVLIYLMLYCWR